MHNQKTPWLFGVVAVALAAMMSRGMLPSGSAGGAPAAPAKAADGEKKAWETSWTDFCSPVCLFQEFLGIPLSLPEEAWPAPAPAIVASAGLQRYDLEFLVVLVPDPVDSHLSNRFDESLEALQRGIAQSGYLFDRVSLPWVGKAAEQRLYRSTPGALLFRKPAKTAAGRGSLLTAFLVGESPKSGIQKRAFFTALDLVTGLQPAAGSSKPLRILGPTFSGSAESLRMALRQWNARSPAAPTLAKIDIVTGSATAGGLEKSFAELGPGVTFARTVVDDDVLQAKAFDFLKARLGWNLGDAALLTEFDTAYGQSFSHDSRSSAPLVVKFPSHLAHIRTAREKLGLDRVSSSSNVPTEARKSLDLSFVDQDQPVDVMPQISELTTQTNDLALAGLLREISRRGIRYVGILATDIQDRLFLAEQIHTYCPDAVVFTFDNHLLDAHPKVARSMDGTLILTSFPLRLGEHDQVLNQYTSELQQGVYQAALRLIKGRRSTPAAWVAVVGNGELWPLAKLPTVPENGRKWPTRHSADDDARFKWLVAALVIALLASWLWQLAGPLQAAVARFPAEEAWAVGAGFLPVLGAGTLCFASGVLLTFYTLPIWSSRNPRWSDGLATNVALALVYAGTVIVLARFAKGWLSRAAAIVVGLLGPVLLALAMRALWLFPEGRVDFYERAGDFSSGLSPLVSLGLLGSAVFAWVVIELKRRRLVVVQDLRWPLQSSCDPVLATSGARAGKLREVLLERVPGPAAWLGLAALFLLPLPRLCRAIQPIAERRAYGMVFVGAVMFVFLLSALSFYRFFRSWRLLEHVLDPLCQSWLLPVFSKASGLIDWKPMRSFGLRMPRLKMTMVSARQLRILSRLGVLGPDGMLLAGGALDKHLARLLATDDAADLLASAEARRDLRPWLDRNTALLEWLHGDAGAAEPVPDDKDGKPVPRQQEVEMREVEIYLALRVAAYLRYVFAHLRYALISASTCGLVLLVAVSSYAFQPKRFLSMGIWAGLLLASLMTLRAFMHMDRNGTLSAISGTDAGKVTLDHTFFTNLFTYFGIPVVGVVLTQFPAVGSLFGDWLGPLLRVAGGQ